MVMFNFFEKSGESKTDVKRSSLHEYFTHLHRPAGDNFQENRPRPVVV
jgi:hypothetical protein